MPRLAMRPWEWCCGLSGSSTISDRARLVRRCCRPVSFSLSFISFPEVACCKLTQHALLMADPMCDNTITVTLAMSNPIIDDCPVSHRLSCLCPTACIALCNSMSIIRSGGASQQETPRIIHSEYLSSRTEFRTHTWVFAHTRVHLCMYVYVYAYTRVHFGAKSRDSPPRFLPKSRTPVTILWHEGLIKSIVAIDNSACHPIHV